MSSPFEGACLTELTKQAALVMPEEISEAGRGIMKLLKPTAGEPAFKYTLKLHPGAKTWEKVIHYGAAPLLAANAALDVKAVREAYSVTPEELQGVGLSPTEALAAQRQIRGAAVGRTAGDAAAWAVYPASFATPLLHHAVTLGSNFALPPLGAHIGKSLA
jgi:hypothetical protein